MKALITTLTLMTSSAFALPVTLTHTSKAEVSIEGINTPIASYTPGGYPAAPHKPQNEKPNREDYFFENYWDKEEIKKLEKKGVLSECKREGGLGKNKPYKCFRKEQFNKDLETYKNAMDTYNSEYKSYEKRVEKFKEKMADLEGEVTSTIEIEKLSSKLSDFKVKLKAERIDEKFSLNITTILSPGYCLNIDNERTDSEVTQREWGDYMYTKKYYKTIMKNFDMNFISCEFEIDPKSYLTTDFQSDLGFDVYPYPSEFINLVLREDYYGLVRNKNEVFRFESSNDSKNLDLNKDVIYDYINYVREEYFLFAFELDTRMREREKTNKILREKLNSMKPVLKTKLNNIKNELKDKSLFTQAVAASLLRRLHDSIAKYEDNELKSDVRLNNALVDL